MLQRLKSAVGWPLESHQQTQVNFQVSASLGHGQVLYVVGTSVVLGGSLDVKPNPLFSSSNAQQNQMKGLNDGLILVSSPELYPIWYNSESVKFKRDTTIYYRYCICSGGKFVRYEHRRLPRVLHVKGTEMMVQDVVETQEEEEELLLLDEHHHRKEAAQENDEKSSKKVDVAHHPTLESSSSSSNNNNDLELPRALSSESPLLNPGTSGCCSGQASTIPIVVPRLSSGQAFIDPLVQQRAEGRSVHRGQQYRQSFFDLSTQQPPPLSSKSATTSIPEENEEELAYESSDVLLTTTKTTFKTEEVVGIARVPKIVNTSEGRHTSSFPELETTTIDSTDGVIIVANYLPVSISKDNGGRWVAQWEDDDLLCPTSRRMLEKASSLREFKSRSKTKTTTGYSPDHDNDHHYTTTTKNKPPNNNNASSMDTLRLTWVGAVRCSSKTDVVTKADEDEITQILLPFKCVPVFFSPEIASMYPKFCRGTLWPVFHNIVDVYAKLPTRWWNPKDQNQSWRSYRDANRLFVNKVIEVYHERDLIWIHGIDLLLTPSFLSRRLPGAHVGLFLHTPFPSSEIFRTLSVRDDLLRGMLSANHIGFHLYEYARHFLTSCRRILGLKYAPEPGGYIGVDYNGRTVAITISHIGIEPPLLDVAATAPAVQDDIQVLQEQYKPQKIVIVGVDALERLMGIPLKLLALEHFCIQYPQWAKKIHVIQWGVFDHLTTQPQQTEECRQEILAIVERINARHEGDSPIITYKEVEKTSLESRIPLWWTADILFISCVRQAVNLFPFEFVYIQHLAQKTGVVILSEFLGSSRVLTGSLGINPWKKDEMVRAIHAALTMTESEKRARHTKDVKYLCLNTRTQWAERVLVDLKKASKQQQQPMSSSSSSDDHHQQQPPRTTIHMGYGLGLGFRMMEFNAGFCQLEIDVVVKSYRSSFRRLILLDYGDTLIPTSTALRTTTTTTSTLGGKSRPEAVPTSVLRTLCRLCDDPRNVVFVLSGMSKEDLGQVLGQVPNLGLAAEHGYYYRWGSSTTSSSSSSSSSLNNPNTVVNWQCAKENFDTSWQDLTHVVMDVYTQRTHGTYIEVKGSAMLWQFRDADPEFGQLQAKELQDQLTQVLEHWPVEVTLGSDYMEVRPEGIDKGAMVDRIISTLESGAARYSQQPHMSQRSMHQLMQPTKMDFILCVGDDKTDECMFSYLHENRPREHLFTCTVGKKPSAAKYFVNDVEAVVELLEACTKVSTTSNRNLSMNDLRAFDVAKSSSSGGLARALLDRDMILPPHELLTLEEEEGGAPESMMKLKLPSSTSSLSKSKYSMSMSALSSAAGTMAPTTSSTLEQYFSNIEEEEDEDGIFF